MPFNTISVIGLGYIGLPTAAVFASRKKRVTGVDVNQYIVDTISRGEIHIVAPDLDMAVHAAVTEGYLQATTVAEPADVFLMAVPTPFKEEHQPPNIETLDGLLPGRCDLVAIDHADLFLVLVDHPEFNTPHVLDALVGKPLIDTRCLTRSSIGTPALDVVA